MRVRIVENDAGNAALSTSKQDHSAKSSILTHQGEINLPHTSSTLQLYLKLSIIDYVDH